MIDFNLMTRIYTYANEHAKSSIEHYNNVTYPKLVENCFDGKVAEFILYFQLLSKGYDLDAPDLDVYNTKHKSFDADLYVKCKDISIHVKSISRESARKYGISVLFSKRDPLVTSPSKRHWIAPMVQIDLLNYELHGWVNAMSANYQETITYQPSKVAIYLG